MNTRQPKDKFSIEKAMAVINSECKIIYNSSDSGKEINKFYVSVRLTIESSLRIVVFKNNPNSDPTKETFANLLTHVRLVPEFNKSFNSFLYEAKKSGNIDAHAINENLQFKIYRLELYQYLDWFFKSFLKQSVPDIFESWYQENVFDGRPDSKLKGNDERRDNEVNRNGNLAKSQDAEKQKKRADTPEESQFPLKNGHAENGSKLTINSGKIPQIEETSNAGNTLDVNSPKSKVSKTDYIAARLEKLKQERKAEEKEFDEEIKKLREFIRPVTGDMFTDFFMINTLKGLVEIKPNKVIILKSTGNIIFDFHNHTVCENHVLKFKRIVNYTEVINKYFVEEMKMRFSVTDMYVGGKKRSYLNFEIGNKVFRARTNKSGASASQKIYLFYCYLLAYMSGEDIYKIANIEDCKNAWRSDTLSINFKWLNGPGTSKKILITIQKKLYDDFQDKHEELNLACEKLKNLEFWEFKAIRMMKNKIRALIKECATLGNNLNEAVMRASR